MTVNLAGVHPLGAQTLHWIGGRVPAWNSWIKIEIFAKGEKTFEWNFYFVEVFHKEWIPCLDSYHPGCQPKTERPNTANTVRPFG